MALTADSKRTEVLGISSHYPLAAGAIVWEGSALGNNGSGYARALVAGDSFLGFAKESVNNTGGAAGAQNVATAIRNVYVLPVTGFLLNNLGTNVYASDDGTFTLTSTGNSLIGKAQRYIADGQAEVRFGFN